MKILKSIEEARKFVYTNEVAVLAYLDLSTELGKLMYSVLRRLESVSRGILAYAVLDISMMGSERPVITAFIKGRQVFEQSDCFGNFKKDYQALRIGLRETLSSWGINPPF
ncbi:MAG: hypothetical protein J7L51_03515 [Desulfurococcales archaeon]|nr:hypothetical protein [Desulfurococcales archaeon]